MVDESKAKSVAITRVLTKAVDELFDYLLEQETCEAVIEMGRLIVSGEILICEDEKPEDDLQIIDAPGVDIFGQSLFKKPNFDVECPKCKRTLAAARFAPHLEKCMGMGRNSSRIASRRLAASSHSNNNSNASAVGALLNSSKSSSQGVGALVGSSGSHVNGDIISEDEHFVEEDEDDEEWTMEKKKKKRNTEKAAPRKKWGPNRLKHSEGRGRRSGPPSYVSSPAPSAVSDQGVENELGTTVGVGVVDPLAISN